MHFPRLPITFAKRIVFDLRNPRTRARGRTLLIAAHARLQSPDPRARMLATDIFRVLAAHRARKGRRTMDSGNYAESMVRDLYHSDPSTQSYVAGEIARLGESGSPIYDEIIGMCHGYEEQLENGSGTVGFSFKKWTKKIKKAVKTVKKVKSAVSKVKKAAKAIKKHNFKKDISKVNKIGKALGPIAAAAPPPYGPAISGGLMALDMVDKYNKGTLKGADLAQAQALIKETGIQETLAKAGVPEAEAFTNIMSVAKNVRNAAKAQETIVRAKKGDKESVAKIAKIKKEAASGSAPAKAALDTLNAANSGMKLSTTQVKTLVRSLTPSDMTPASQAVAALPRGPWATVTTPSGPVRIMSNADRGVSVEIAIATGMYQ